MKFLIPRLDETFDRVVVKQMRAMLEEYLKDQESFPIEYRGLFENIAIMQGVEQ